MISWDEWYAVIKDLLRYNKIEDKDEDYWHSKYQEGYYPWGAFKTRYNRGSSRRINKRGN